MVVDGAQSGQTPPTTNVSPDCPNHATLVDNVYTNALQLFKVPTQVEENRLFGETPHIT